MEFASSSYDVLINFNGEEIRRKFVSHLDSSLSSAGFSTFLHEENVVKEIQLQEQLSQAKEMCRVAVIVVFTKTYAESAWCLHELQQIIQWHETYCRHVLPVYYEIQPSDVRLQKGDFGKALKATAQQTFSPQQVEPALFRWRRALTKAANFFGWDESNYRSDAELVDKIFKSVLYLPVLSATKFPVGLQSQVEDVIQMIEDESQEVVIIGICGMGGSGKTTIAKAVYYQMHAKFTEKGFLEDITQTRETRELVHLQRQLLLDVLKTKVEIPSVEVGASMIKERIRKRMLIVFDDVDDVDSIDYLCGNGKWLGQGTVIIITTRDINLLKRLEVNNIYSVGDKNQNDSLKIFSWYAFREEKPREDFNELARNVVRYCGGLPLALEVLGSYLSEKTEKEWNSVLSKLKKNRNKVIEKLRISFDGLRNPMEKDIFLDVYCFFVGKDRGYVTDILNGCGLEADIGIAVLIERSLLKVEKNNKLGMNRLLRDMGREIIRESSRYMGIEYRNRVYFDDFKCVIRNDRTEAIQGLFLKSPLSSTSWEEVSALSEMKLMKWADLRSVIFTGDYSNPSKQLRWIYHLGFPLEYISENCDMEGVIAIHLKCSNLRLFWNQPRVLGWLKFLNLSHSKYLTETPDFSGLPSLEKLILKDCPSLCKVHQSIGDLCNLLLMNLKNCTSLSNLPREVYKVKSLKTLILSGCMNIDISEEDIVKMESLITLIAEDKAVKQIPFSIVSSKFIGYISLPGFEGLSHNLFPSIIRSWMSPTINPLSYIHPSFCMDTPLLSGLTNLRSILVQCDTKFQLSTQVNTFLAEYSVRFTEFRISEHHLRFSLIDFGSYHNKFFNTLSNSIYEALENSESCDVSLPADNHPYWLAHMGVRHSIYFTMPQDCEVKGIVLCVVYLSDSEIPATEFLTSVLIVNYTKCTLQIHKHGTVISFNDIDWQGIISNLRSGDKVEIFVTFGNGLVVKNTAIYLIYGESKKNAPNNFLKKIVMCDF